MGGGGVALVSGFCGMGTVGKFHRKQMCLVCGDSHCNGARKFREICGAGERTCMASCLLVLLLWRPPHCNVWFGEYRGSFVIYEGLTWMGELEQAHSLCLSCS